VKALYISSKPAFPKVDGGCVASADFLELLVSAGIEIKYLTISTNKHPFNKEDFPADLSAKIAPESMKIETAVRPLEAFKYLFIKKSYNIDRFYNIDFEDKIFKELDAASYDLIIFDSLYATPYLGGVRERFKGKIVIRTHNLEYKIWDDLAGNERKAVKAKYLKLLAKDLKSYELTVLNHVDGILTLSEDDLNDMKALGVTSPIITIPVTATCSEKEHDYALNSLFHLGAMNWQPNIEAVDYILDLWPEIRSKNTELEFHIAGIYAENEFDSNQAEGIIVDGYVENLEAFIENSGILLTPIQSGSGVRIKILEMMSHGIPVITTSLGAQGLSSLDGVQIANSKDEIIAAVYELVNDENKRRDLGMKAKSYINLHHNPKTVRATLIEFIRSI
jgi:glycosyltransferase involved in cell wall biosynthesis